MKAKEANCGRGVQRGGKREGQRETVDASGRSRRVARISPMPADNRSSAPLGPPSAVGDINSGRQDCHVPDDPKISGQEDIGHVTLLWAAA